MDSQLVYPEIVAHKTYFHVNNDFLVSMAPPQPEVCRFDIILNRTKRRAWLRLNPEGDYKICYNSPRQGRFGSKNLQKTLRSMWDVEGINFTMSISLNRDERGRYEIQML